jgi:hypothetical protein
MYTLPQDIDFTPLFTPILQYPRLILGLGLLAVLVFLPRSLSGVLALVLVIGLLVILVPGSVHYLLAVGRAVFNLFAFLLAGSG